MVHVYEEGRRKEPSWRMTEFKWLRAGEDAHQDRDRKTEPETAVPWFFGWNNYANLAVKNKPESSDSDGVLSLPLDVKGLADTDLLPVARAGGTTLTLLLGSGYLFCRQCYNMFEDVPTHMATDRLQK